MEIDLKDGFFGICLGSFKLSMASPVCCSNAPNLPSRSPDSGASLACSRMEKLATKVTDQRNRSYKYSRPVSVTPQMRYMSRNRAPAAHRAFPKNSHKPGFDRLGEQILSEYRPPASDTTAKWCIISCVIPWLAAMTTLLYPTDLRAAHR